MTPMVGWWGSVRFCPSMARALILRSLTRVTLVTFASRTFLNRDSAMVRQVWLMPSWRGGSSTPPREPSEVCNSAPSTLRRERIPYPAFYTASQMNS